MIPLSEYIPALIVAILLARYVFRSGKKEQARTDAMNERINAQLQLKAFEQERRAWLEEVKPHLQAVADRGVLSWHNGIRVLLNEWNNHSSRFIIEEIRQLQINMTHSETQALKMMGAEEYKYFMLLDIPEKVCLPENAERILI